jgi:hypothetical protein
LGTVAPEEALFKLPLPELNPEKIRLRKEPPLPPEMDVSTIHGAMG